MKKLYSFTMDKELEVEEPQISKNDKGEEVKTITKTKKMVPQKYFVAYPTRKLREDAEFYHASIMGECLKRGILSAALLQKRYIEDGGVLSQDQKKEYNEYYEKLFSKQAEHRQLVNKEEKTEDDKKNIEKIFNEVINILTVIQTFESQANISLYQDTAESIARNRTANWFMLHLSYEEKDGKEIPFFGNGNFEEKLKKYDLIDQNATEFDIKLVSKFLLISSLWYFGKADKQEDFDVLITMSENKDAIDSIRNLKPEENQDQQELNLI